MPMGEEVDLFIIHASSRHIYNVLEHKCFCTYPLTLHKSSIQLLYYIHINIQKHILNQSNNHCTNAIVIE